MTTGKTLNIHPIGLSLDEMHVLKSICHVSSLSSLRPRRYSVDYVNDLPSDVYIVNGDCPRSVDAWQSRHDRHQKPTLFLSKDSGTSGRNILNRPAIPSRLLSALDHATS